MYYAVHMIASPIIWRLYLPVCFYTWVHYTRDKKLQRFPVYWLFQGLDLAPFNDSICVTVHSFTNLLLCYTLRCVTVPVLPTLRVLSFTPARARESVPNWRSFFAVTHRLIYRPFHHYFQAWFQPYQPLLS